MGTISLEASSDALQQSMRDFLEAHDRAMGHDRIAMALAVSSSLTAIRYTLANGSTPEARLLLEGARKQIHAAMGID